MDTINAITTIISNVGFPIACVFVMFYTQNKEREEHREESKSFTEAINNNTLAITKLCEKMEDMR